MNKIIEIDEAIKRAIANGKDLTVEELAKAMFPQLSEHAACFKLYKLRTGRTKRVEINQVLTICRVCGCSPNLLFGYECE